MDLPIPPPAPAKWLGLIGEYGWDHDKLFILERDGKLNALIEWFYLYPLTEESENVYTFPDFGLYHDEKLVFTRDPSGHAVNVIAAGVTFDRRRIDGEDGKTFTFTRNGRSTHYAKKHWPRRRPDPKAS